MNASAVNRSLIAVCVVALAVSIYLPCVGFFYKDCIAIYLHGASIIAAANLQLDKLIYASDHPSVARESLTAGNLALREGRLDEGMRLLDEALRIRLLKFGSTAQPVAAAVMARARAECIFGDAHKADALLQQALQLDSLNLYSTQSAIAVSEALGWLDSLYRTTGDYKQAEKVCRERLSWEDLKGSIYEVNDWELSPDSKREEAQADLARCLILEGKLKEAQELIDSAMKLVRKEPTLDLLLAQASLAYSQNKFDQAEGFLRQVLNHKESIYAENNAGNESWLASCLCKQGKLDEAASHARHAFKCLDAVSRKESADRAVAAARLGEVLLKKGNTSESGGLLVEAKKIMDDQMPRSVCTAEFYQVYADYLRKVGQAADAKEADGKAKDILASTKEQPFVLPSALRKEKTAGVTGFFVEPLDDENVYTKSVERLRRQIFQLESVDSLQVLSTAREQWLKAEMVETSPAPSASAELKTKLEKLFGKDKQKFVVVATARLHLAEILISMGQPDEARHVLELALPVLFVYGQGNGTYQQAVDGLALCLMKVEDEPKAAVYARRLLESASAAANGNSNQDPLLSSRIISHLAVATSMCRPDAPTDLLAEMYRKALIARERILGADAVSTIMLRAALDKCNTPTWTALDDRAAGEVLAADLRRYGPIHPHIAEDVTRRDLKMAIYARYFGKDHPILTKLLQELINETAVSLPTRWRFLPLAVLVSGLLLFAAVYVVFKSRQHDAQEPFNFHRAWFLLWPAAAVCGLVLWNLPQQNMLEQACALKMKRLQWLQNIVQKAGGAQSRAYAKVLSSIGELYLVERNYSEAQKYYLQAIDVLERKADIRCSLDPDRWSAYKRYAQVLRSMGAVQDAQAFEGAAICESGSPDSAIDLCTKAINGKGEDARAYSYRGYANFRKGLYNDAVTDFGSAIRILPSDSWLYARRAQAYNELKDYPKAIDDASKALKLNSNNAIAYEARGWASHKLGDEKQALSDYRQAAQLDPALAKQYLDPSASQQDSGRLSIELLTRAIMLNPDYVDAYIDRAQGWNYLEDYPKVVADYSQALRLLDRADSRYAEVLTDRANAHAQMEAYAQAVDDWNELALVDANSAAAQEGLARSYYGLGQYQKTIDRCSKWIYLGSDDQAALELRASAHNMLGQWKEAIKDCDDALEQPGNDQQVIGAAHATRALAYARLGQKDKAQADLSAVVSPDSDSYGEQLDSRADAYLRLKEYDKAIADATKRISRGGELKYAYLNRGIAYLHKGDYSRAALADFNKCIKLDKWIGECYYCRAIAYDQQGNSALAQKDREKAKQLNYIPDEVDKMEGN